MTKKSIILATVFFLGFGHRTGWAKNDITRFKPPPTNGGLLATDSTEELYPGQMMVSGYFCYADNPLVWRYQDNSFSPIIERQLLLHMVATAGIIRFVDLGAALPLALLQQGPTKAGMGDLSGFALGDLRLMPRITLFNAWTHRYGLVFIPEISLPTGAADKFLGNPFVAFRPKGVFSVPLYPLRLFLSLGYHLRQNRKVAGVALSDEWDFSIGATLSLNMWRLPFKPIVELNGSTDASKPFIRQGLSALYLLIGGHVELFRDYMITTGVSAGLSRGVGSPRYQLIAAFSYSPQLPDQDGDGLPDDYDDCPTEAEDFDGFKDTDGCPEWDNDQDGIPDIDDDCPDEAEDYNGIFDNDGCPDAPGQDYDKDGIPDDLDHCPTQAEDRDGFEDDDGCPDHDHDHDGIKNDADRCPREKETINGIDDYDGCPDEGEGQTKYIENKKIEITETILFEFSKSVIKEQSKPILDQVALQILAHPEISKISIEGHTDSIGSKEDNLFLSQDRADSVRRYLINKDVPKQKLEAVGYGEDRPIADNNSKEERAKNRRVEFVIAETYEE